MNQTRTHNTYRRLRKDGWRAQEALRHAKDDQRLEDAEDAGLIRFRWEWDDDFRPADMSDIPELIAEEERRLEDGSWEVQGCVAEVKEVIPEVFVGGGDLEYAQWVISDSLWGIVGPFDQSDQDYRRSVEIDLAYESGVLK